MQRFEVSYVVVSTGVQNTVIIPDPAEDEFGAGVARAIDSALKRYTAIKEVSTVRITDTRSVAHTDISAVP